MQLVRACGRKVSMHYMYPFTCLARVIDWFVCLNEDHGTSITDENFDFISEQNASCA